MVNEQNYPWYAQQDGAIKILYDGFFPIAEAMSPLTLGDAFNIDNLTGKALISVGYMYGLSPTGAYYTGLLWSSENWDEQVWTGEQQAINEQVYKNYIKMKAYINGRPYTLNLLNEALTMLMSGIDGVGFYVTEDTMSFVIHVVATEAAAEAFRQVQLLDYNFLGKPTGISYIISYEEQ